FTSHITFYELASLGTIFVGLTFALQLWFKKGSSRTANRFLSLALGVMVLWMAGLSGIGLEIWDLPLRFSLAFGPLIYFYVRRTTQPERRFRWKDLLHFCPVLLQQVIWLPGLASVVKPLLFISIGIYLFFAHKLIERFYAGQKFNEGD